MNRHKASESTFNIITSLFFVVVSFITIYPFINALAYSFSNGVSAMTKPVVFLPVDFTLENYRTFFVNNTLFNSVIISVARTLAGTMCFLIVTGLCAYSISKKSLVGKKFLLGYFIIPMFMGGGLLPYYIVIHSLGLFNNFLVYILPGTFSTFLMLLMKVFFEGIPESLEEAAIIDGAAELRIFISVYLPLSMPIIATVSLFVAVGQWNSWFDSMLFITNDKLYPLQMMLQNIIKQNEVVSYTQVQNITLGSKKVTSETIKMTVLIITTVPILAVYPFLQKYFIKGMMVGAVKM